MAKLTVPKNKQVTIRSYCQGFGDCFLIAFSVPKEDPKYVVIDCGILFGASMGHDRMNMVAEDIKEATGGHVDVLVITHEHYDHVSGFLMADEIWKTIDVEEVWLAWTERDEDIVAKEIGELKSKIVRAIKRLRLNTATYSDSVTELLNLSDVGVDVLPGFGAKKFNTGTREGRDIAIALSKSEPIFCEPGEVRTLGSSKVKAIVLGPPRDAALLKVETHEGHQFEKFMASSEENALSAYSSFLSFDLDAKTGAFGLSAAAPSEDYKDRVRERLGLPIGGNAKDRWEPFGPRFRFTQGSRRWDAYIADPLNDSAVKAHADVRNDWRRIGGESAATIEGLALQLTDFVNNLSLALAFQLRNGKYLLFPADAEAGNWLSWGKSGFHDADSGDAIPSLAIESIMKGTVFYKVGHHGSHNGTYITDRFELIPNTAHVFMPFELAPSWPLIPAKGLMRHLDDQGYPYARSDNKVKPKGKFKPAKVQMPYVEPNSNTKDVKFRPLYVDLTL